MDFPVATCAGVVSHPHSLARKVPPGTRTGTEINLYERLVLLPFMIRNTTSFKTSSIILIHPQVFLQDDGDFYLETSTGEHVHSVTENDLKVVTSKQTDLAPHRCPSGTFVQDD